MKRKIHNLSIAVIVPMRNSSTTVLKTIASLRKQKYYIQQIIVIDNASSDDSVNKVSRYIKHEHVYNMRLVIRKINTGVGSSYNLGVKLAKTKYVVFMHSDGTLSSADELHKLVKPIERDASIIATYSHVIVPVSVWEQFPFWEKCLLARSIGSEIAGLNGKFDCIKKREFEKVGGFDEVQYGHDVNIGGEDGDLHMRLRQVGKVVVSNAKVIHLHSLDPSYSLAQWIQNRKLLARSYGRLIRLQWGRLDVGALLFFVKPILTTFPLLLPRLLSVLIFIVYTILSMRIMYINTSSRNDIRIFLLPFISIFLVYYETFWMIESFLLLAKK